MCSWYFVVVCLFIYFFFVRNILTVSANPDFVIKKCIPDIGGHVTLHISNAERRSSQIKLSTQVLSGYGISKYGHSQTHISLDLYDSKTNPTKNHEKKNTIAKWKYAWFVLLSTISIKENDFLFCSKKGNSYFCSFLESHKTQFVCLIFFLLLNFVHLIILLICDKNKWQYWWYFCEIYLTTPSCFVLFFNLEPTENKWRCNVHIKERF